MLKQPGEGVDRDVGLAFCLDGGHGDKQSRANRRQNRSGGGSENARVLEMFLG